MIIGKNFFINEMPKTGSTFVRNYFKQFDDVKLTIKHETISENKKINLLNKKHKIGIIRNPYEWYLSYWKWSCLNKKKSPIYSDLTSSRIKLKRLKFNNNLIYYIFSQLTKNKIYLKSLFSDINSKNNFNKFLNILLNSKNKNIIGSDYSFIPHKDLGYMTFIFFTQNVSQEDYKILFNQKEKFGELLKKLDNKIYTNFFFKTENLVVDIKKFLKKNKIKIKKFKNIKKNSASNNFDRNKLNFFYKQNIKLIEKKDSYLFEKFKYKKITK